MAEEEQKAKDKSETATTAQSSETPFYPDKPQDDVHRLVFASKEPGQFYDPCSIASKMSYKCLERNDFDKTKCQDYFQAYKDCKKEWQRKRSEDRKNGLSW